MARTFTLNWQIPIGVPGLGSFGGISTPWSHVSTFLGCLSKFKEVLKDTRLFKSTKSVPMAGLYDHFLENLDWRMAACITMGYRRLTDHQNELQGEAYSGTQLTTMIWALVDRSGVVYMCIKMIPVNSDYFIHTSLACCFLSLAIHYISRFNQVYIIWWIVQMKI